MPSQYLLGCRLFHGRSEATTISNPIVQGGKRRRGIGCFEAFAKVPIELLSGAILEMSASWGPNPTGGSLPKFTYSS